MLSSDDKYHHSDSKTASPARATQRHNSRLAWRWVVALILALCPRAVPLLGVVSLSAASIRFTQKARSLVPVRTR